MDSGRAAESFKYYIQTLCARTHLTDVRIRAKRHQGRITSVKLTTIATRNGKPSCDPPCRAPRAVNHSCDPTELFRRRMDRLFRWCNFDFGRIKVRVSGGKVRRCKFKIPIRLTGGKDDESANLSRFFGAPRAQAGDEGDQRGARRRRSA